MAQVGHKNVRNVKAKIFIERNKTEVMPEQVGVAVLDMAVGVHKRGCLICKLKRLVRGTNVIFAAMKLL